MRRKVSTALLLLLALVSAVCSKGGEGEGEGEGESEGGSIKIALEAPLTGDQASYGADLYNATKLAVDEFNAEGGLFGRKIELVKADDQADPTQGVAVAQQMVAAGAFAVIGPFNSSVGVSNLPVYLDGGVIPIHLTSTQGTRGLGYNVVPKDYQVGPTEAAAISGFFKAHRVAIVYDTSTYTAGIALQLRDALVSEGVEVVGFEGIAAGEVDYSSVIAGLKADNPDLFYVSTYYPEGGLIAKQAAQIGMPGVQFMGLAVQDPQFVDIAGLDVAQNVYVSGVPSAEQLPRAAQYVKDYAAQFDTPPGAWGTFAYDSVKLLIDAVKRAGSWDTAKVIDALKQTDGLQGVTGDISIDPITGDREEVPVVVLRVDSAGEFVIDPAWAKFAGFIA